MIKFKWFAILYSIIGKIFAFGFLFSYIYPIKTDNMKIKYLFLFIILFFSWNSLSASHLMGGEITARQLSGNDYEVTMIVYRDTLGIPMSLIGYFDLNDSSGTPIYSFSTPYSSVTSGILIPGYPYGVEMYVFIDTITLPGTGTFSVEYFDCCRNAAIMNMASPASESMILTTTVTNSVVSNSTPVFLSPPVFFVQVNTPWTYNPLPYDADGDSLSWNLTTPIGLSSIPVAGYFLPLADTIGPFLINAITGEISWTPNTLGNFSTSVLVEEYRNGIKIGEIRRDMQMIVVADTSQVAKITNFGSIPLNNLGVPFIPVQSNQPYSLTLFAYDPNPMETLRFEAYGEPFLFDQSAATFSLISKKNVENSKTGIFEWNPSSAMVRTNPYSVAFRVGDNYFTHDYTVFFQVSHPASISTTNYFSIGNIYPNPASSIIILPVSLEKETKIAIKILDLLGNEKMYIPGTYYGEGKHLISSTIYLQSGQYIVQILRNDVVYKTQKILVVK